MAHSTLEAGDKTLKILDIVLLAGLAIFTAVVIVVISVTTGFTYPLSYSEVPKSGNNTPVCYMETEDGRVLDLSSLCRKASDVSISTPIPKPILTNLSDPTPLPSATPQP